MKFIEILFVENNPGDVDPAREARETGQVRHTLHANCLITKPIDLNHFIKVVQAIKDFWFTIVKLPPNGAEK